MIFRVRYYLVWMFSLVFLLLNHPLIAQYGPRRSYHSSNSFDSFGGPSDTTGWFVSFLIGALLGAFFSDRFRKYRMYVWYGLMAVCAFLAISTHSPLAYLAWFLIGFVTAYQLLKDWAAARAANAPPTTFGSAQWADLAHLQQNGLIGTDGFWLGTFVENGRRHSIQYSGDRHLLTVGPTGSGKGVASILPNFLTYTGSAVAIDPKGEIARITAEQRQRLGHAVYVVDPWGLTGFESARFNPLDWLQPDDPDVGENALLLADSMIDRTGGQTSDPFWDNESVALLWGFILYVALTPSEAKTRNLGRVRDLISSGPEELDKLLKVMALHENDIVSSTGVRTLAKEDKVRSSVFTSLQSHTHFLDSPRMRDSLSASDFRFEDMKASKMTVFLVLPADRLSTFGRWLRLLIQQAITVNARNIATAKPEKPVLFLLEEMAALGRLTKVEEAFGLMAGFGLQLWGVVQDLAQMERIYGKGWETFIGNSGALQYFGSRDVKTSEYFSKLCGVTTIVKTSLSRSIAMAFGKSGSTTTNTTNTDHIQRQLAFPDELMVMRKNQSLVLIENNNPINAQKLTWYKDERLRHLGVNLGPRSTSAGTK